MAATNSTTPNTQPALIDAVDMLSEARSMAAFVQSTAINANPGQSMTLHPDQLSGMGYTLQGVIDRIKLASIAIDCAHEASWAGSGHAGAIAGLEALRNIERIAERMKTRSSNGDGLTMSEWWQIQDDAVEAMYKGVGKQSAFVNGLLATVAEYVMLAQDGGIPDLDHWKPEAIMTETEKTASRTKFADEVTASMA